ncbi:MAG: hypothetical protein JWM93_3613 [Frankiales bacterium]|nr:hypothetical protein [Frankiales bacterium]
MSEQQATERRLWTLTLAGDAQAFAQLFDLHRDRAFRQAWRLVDGREEAEDIAAAAFLELWRRREDVRLVGDSVLPWLMVTTANLALNSARGHRRYRAFLANLPRERHVQDSAEASVHEGMAGIDSRVRAVLRSLPEHDRLLLTLVSLEDLAIADAAAVLGISPAAAKTRLHRVRERVRAQLGDLAPATVSEGDTR